MARLDPEDLAGDVGAIRAVALDVLGDPDGAEDVVQETLLAAWLRGPREGGPRGTERVRAWMRRCAKNAALQRLRGARRRRLREEGAAAHEAQASAEEVLDRVALQRRVAAAVEALRSPDREIVALRYWDGLAPREIARRLGLTPNAVSTRLARAKARLRADLEDERPTSGASWALVAARWTDPVPSPIPPSPLHWIPAGTLAVKKTLVTAAGCLAAVAALVWLSDLVFVERDRQPSTGAERVVELATPRDEALTEVAQKRSARTAPEAVETPNAARRAEDAPLAASPPSTGAILVTVTDGSTGEAEPGIGLHLVVFSSLTWFHSRRAVTDAEGVCRFDGVPPGDATVYANRLTGADSYGAEGAVVVAGETAEVRFTMYPGVTIHGVVRDGAGRPVEGADVWLGDGTGAPYHGHVVTRTDARGRYEIAHARGLHAVAARAPGWAPSRARMAMNGVEDARGLRVDLVLPGPGGTLEGIVLGPTGEPAAGALVTIGDTRRQQGTKEGEEFTWPAPFVELRADAEGRFRTDRMGAGPIPVRARDRATGVAEEDVLVPVGGVASVELRLEPAATIHGVVRASNGEAVADAVVSSLAGEEPLLRFDARVDAEGRFELESLTAGTVELEVDSRAEGSTLRDTLELRPGERREWNPVLASTLSLSGRVVTADGTPLEGWHVRREAEGADGPRASGVTRTDADGRFTLEGCADRPHALSVRPPGRLFGSAAAELQGVSPTDDPATLVVPADAVPTASLTGRVVDGDGAPRRVTISMENPEVETFEDVLHLQLETDDAGRFHVGHLLPGRYVLRLASEADGTSFELEPIEIADGQAYQLGAIVAPVR
ncbi:MAG: sigma-70 family RNA polymerase sigma factor [Planctomycetota bacterium]